jgi:hypothetical protein
VSQRGSYGRSKLVQNYRSVLLAQSFRIKWLQSDELVSTGEEEYYLNFEYRTDAFVRLGLTEP